MEGVAEGSGSFNALKGDIVTALAEDADDHLGVKFGIFNDQDTERDLDGRGQRSRFAF